MILAALEWDAARQARRGGGWAAGPGFGFPAELANDDVTRGPIENWLIILDRYGVAGALSHRP